MKSKEAMTKEEKIAEIMRLFSKLTDDNMKTFTAALDAIVSKSLDNAPESFKEYLKQPGNEEFAKTFH